MLLENGTENNNTYEFDSKTWLIDMLINGILVILSAYLLSALIFYKINVEQPTKQRFYQLSAEIRYRVLSLYICTIVAVASLLGNVNAFARKWVERNAVHANITSSQEEMLETICNIIPPLGNFALTGGSGMVYVFLWLRQRVFYIHPFLKDLNNMFIKVFSFGIIILWLVFYLSVSIAYFCVVRYNFHKNLGCLVEQRIVATYKELIEAFTFASILMQICLLFLFIYPILKRTLWKDQQHNDHNLCLLRRVKKAVVLTFVCLGSDIATITAIILLLKENSSSIIFEYGVNLVINLLVTIACFDYWKKLLWPWTSKPAAVSVTQNLSNPSTRIGSKELSDTEESRI